MSKQLLIMRHAKSSWDHPGLSDFDRPLNERGKQDAPDMGKRILQHPFIPDQIVSSPAKRAFKTAKEVAEAMGLSESDITREYDIYDADIPDLLQVIRNMDERWKKVILIGHNPGLTGLIGYLSESLIEHLPTAGVALLSFDIHTWKQVHQHQATLKWFDFPKNKS